MKKVPICIKIMRLLFPKQEKERREYRKCISFASAHLDDLLRTAATIKEKK